jgi:transposase
MDNVTTIALDIAKSVFQLHGVDVVGEVVIRRKLTRGWRAGWERKVLR